MTASSFARFCGGALALAVVALAFAPGGCGKAVSTPPARATFVGNAACAECHKSEFEKHKDSRHARTLHAAAVSELGALAPPAGAIGDSGCTIRREGDTLYLRTPATGQEVRLEFALGSGKTGVTFVGLDGKGGVEEGRMSYFPAHKRWFITPGQERRDGDSPSLNQPPAIARRCLGCHSVTVPETSLKIEPRFFGVGCERCHGPGSAHIEAARRKDRDLRMEKMIDWPATRINEACGNCHRTPAEVGNTGLDMTMTNRFQSFGLMQSPCFRKSGGAISCISCHDPHSDATTRARDYELVCLTCHEGPKHKQCPVNPKEKCITCHMPTRPVFPRSHMPIEMADHLIWAYGKKPKP